MAENWDSSCDAYAVELRSVSVEFGTIHALIDVDLTVRVGESVALVGQSGAGKSTLLRLCSGALNPSAGEVQVFGACMAGKGAGGLRAVQRRIGAVHQQLHLVGPLRVVHNVNAGRLGSWRLPRALRSLVHPSGVAEARAALDRVGIADKLFERTDRLSGGEQQRVALARVLVQDPDLIVADEPVSSLDPARSEVVMDILTRVLAGSGATLIVSLHDFGIARRYCDRLVGIRAGRVVFDRPANEVTDWMGEELYRIVS